MLWQPDHPQAGRKGYVMEHRLVVERAIGKALRADADVHHVNGVRDDNNAGNLVACESREYHWLLHVRARALSECGNANWRPCGYCKQWDAPEAMVRKNRNQMTHQRCRAKYYAAYKLRLRLLAREWVGERGED
jgi:hypothetical protein